MLEGKGAGVRVSRGAGERNCSNEESMNRKPIKSHRELEVYQLVFQDALGASLICRWSNVKIVSL